VLASAPKSAKRWTNGSIISSNRIWLDGKVSGSSSLGTFSARCADASSTKPHPNCRPTGSHPPSTSRRRACLGHLSPARHARVGAVRNDRRWSWFPAGSMAAGAGAEVGSAGIRHVNPSRGGRLELPAQARTWPVVVIWCGSQRRGKTPAGDRKWLCCFFTFVGLHQLGPTLDPTLRTASSPNTSLRRHDQRH
jgi:hypothetical protein